MSRHNYYKGPITTVIDSTASQTSAIIDTQNFNGAVLHNVFDATAGAFTVKVQTGPDDSTASMIDLYDERGVNQYSKSMDGSAGAKAYTVKGLMDYSRFISTRDATGSKLTTKVQPINL